MLAASWQIKNADSKLIYFLIEKKLFYFFNPIKNFSRVSINKFQNLSNFSAFVYFVIKWPQLTSLVITYLINEQTAYKN